MAPMPEPQFQIVPNAVETPRELPHNVEAEAALLGAMMIDNRVAEDVMQRLRGDHFFDPLNGRIYDAILRLTTGGTIANPVTLKPLFESDEAMRALGGPIYLAQLTGSGAGLIGAKDFAKQIYDLAMLRALVGVGRDLVDSAMDTSEAVDPRAQIESAEMRLYKVAEEGGETGSTKSFVQATKLAVDLAEKAQNAGGKISGVTTGMDSVNAKTGGLHHSDLLILAGRPGMGKTSFATNVAFNAAKRYLRDKQDGIPHEKSLGAKVAFFSLEMSADQLATRILAEQSGVIAHKIRSGSLTRDEFTKFARAASELEDLPLFIDDTAGLTIAALTTRARRLKRRHEIGMIIVDYLQLLTGSGKNKDGNRVQEISEISRGLKTLAKELHLPVIALSQLSRQVENREDKRPQLSDLRESGSIEQDADIVLFVYREEYYVQSVEPKVPGPEDDAKVHEAYNEWGRKMQTVAGTAELIVAKQRHGSTGRVKLKFESSITKFSDLIDDAYLPDRTGYE